MDSINGVYGLDDIAKNIDEPAIKIVGESEYNLTDLFMKIDKAADQIEGKIDQATNDIGGPVMYNLTDLFTELSEINSKTYNQ